jgi:Type I phosphodiesterase / nucleotide pyrophosphatase
MLYPNTNMYQRYAAKGVETHIYQSADFCPSVYDLVVSAGVSKLHPFSDFSTALTDIAALIKKADGTKRYIYCYFGDIDDAGHEYGTNSPEFIAAVTSLFSQLETYLFAHLTNQNNTLIVLTADHGQTDIDPATTVYINQIIPEMETWIKRNKAGKAMMPGGSARDLFVYIKDEYLDIAFATLTEKLAGKAEVYYTKGLLAAGLFGDKPGSLLLGRLSNICILPYRNDSVYWFEADKFEQTFYGHHGGLTPEEMETIFLTLEV